MPLYYWIPLLNAFLFTVAALCIKRATTSGVGPWRTTFLSNAALFLVAIPLWFFGKPLESAAQLLIPLCIGATFFLGQLLACLAIHKGDVSLLTPLLGTKTVFVAFMVWLGLGEQLTPAVWLGAFLSSIAILLMRGGNAMDRSRVALSIYLGLACAFAYAGTDSLTQAYGRNLGFHKLAAGTFTSVMLFSFLLVPLFKSPLSRISNKTWGWMALGAGLMALQATLMAYVLSNYGKATVVNVLYSSRGIWSIVLVWLVGHWFSNRERHLGKSVMLRRLAGAILLMVAILAVVRH